MVYSENRIDRLTKRAGVVRTEAIPRDIEVGVLSGGEGVGTKGPEQEASSFICTIPRSDTQCGD